MIVKSSWTTVEEIAEARRRFEDAIPGWRRPVAFAIGLVTDQGVDFVRVNIEEAPLPAAILATVCGHRGGSASYRLDPPVGQASGRAPAGQQ